MKRKVVKQGPSTLMISLPSKWVKSHNIGRGQELEVVEELDGLRILFQKKKKTVERISLDVSSLKPRPVSILLAILHKKGFDEIELFYKTSEQLKVIRNRVHNSTIGFEIIEQSKKRCLIKNISEGNLYDVDMLMQRVFHIATSMMRTTLEALQEGRYDELEEVLALEDTINKLTNYCEREIIKNSVQTKENFLLYIIIWSLESMADQLRDVCYHFSEQKQKLHTKILTHFEYVFLFYEAFSSAYFDFKQDNISKFYDRHDFLKKHEHQLNMKKPHDVFLLHTLSRVTALIHEAFPSLMGLKVKN